MRSSLHGTEMYIIRCSRDGEASVYNRESAKSALAKALDLASTDRIVSVETPDGDLFPLERFAVLVKALAFGREDGG